LARAIRKEVALTGYYLTDERWALIASHLPGKEGDPGCHGRDNRLFIEAVFWIVRTGSPWRSLPPHFGKWYTNYTRFRRWTQKRVWPGVLDALAADESCEYISSRRARFAMRRCAGSWPRKVGRRRRPKSPPEARRPRRPPLHRPDGHSDASAKIARNENRGKAREKAARLSLPPSRKRRDVGLRRRLAGVDKARRSWFG